MQEANRYPSTHLTILSKNTLFSFLGLVHTQRPTSEEDGQAFTAIVKLDPREGQPILKEFTTYSEAFHSYHDAVDTSISRGWSVIYRGIPLNG